MKPKEPNQDRNCDEWCEEEMLKAYKDAAEYDRYMFGDFDYTKVWLDNITKEP